MADQDKDLVQLFVRDLDDIELPPRERWRPESRKESHLMKTSRYVLYASAVVAVLVLAFIASLALRNGNQVAATPSPTSPTTTPSTATPPPTAAPAGAITGAIGYPAGFYPAMTVYAINVADQRIFFSVERPRYPAVAGATMAPGTPTTYTITGVAPGTYYVLAYRNSDLGGNDQPGLYSQFVLRCVQPSLAGTQVPADCTASSNDHVVVPVTVRPGETVSRIDVSDWFYVQATYPPRPRS